MTKEQVLELLPNKGVNDILLWQEYINKYGADTTLKEAFEKVKFNSRWRNLNHKCPQCFGNGYIIEEYNAYPSGLPDSGFVYKPGFDYKVCPLCKGFGYTEEKYEPKTETRIVGYEKVKNHE